MEILLEIYLIYIFPQLTISYITQQTMPFILLVYSQQLTVKSTPMFTAYITAYRQAASPTLL